MSKNTNIQERVENSSEKQIVEASGQIGGLSLIGIMRRLPNLILVPGTIALFGLLLTDLAIADPVPVIDEAAIFWTMITGLKVLGERRKARKLDNDVIDEPIVVADVMPEAAMAPGQPLS